MSIVLIVAFAFLLTSHLTAAQELSSKNESVSFPLRSAVATQQLQAMSDSSETCSLPEAHTAIEEAFHQVLQENVLDKLTCNDTDSASLGIFQFCPAANCSQISSASPIYRFPGYYWITAKNGSAIRVYCSFEFEHFAYASAEIDNMADNTCPTTERREYVQEKTKAGFRPQLSQMSPSLLTCTAQITGLVAHCPANNCSQLFDLIHEGFLRLSNYYWLRSPDGNVTEVYCNRSTRQPEYSSCQQVFQFETMSSGMYTLRTSDGDYSSEAYCNETGLNEYRSCSDANVFGLPSGTYTIWSSGSPVTVYCDMDKEECGGGGWTRVASYNYSDPSISCPNTWTQITDPFRGCAVAGGVTTNNCASTSFSALVEFNQVCGEVIAIQYGSPDGFYPRENIDNNYVEGVSITHGSPRQHIWTFAAYPGDDYTETRSICPCSQPSLNVPPPLSFVGSNYFCDTAAETRQSGWHLNDPLWDGEGCSSTSTCCSFNNPPWFTATLPQHTTDDIEVRICDNDSNQHDDTAIVLLNLYIK